MIVLSNYSKYEDFVVVWHQVFLANANNFLTDLFNPYIRTLTGAITLGQLRPAGNSNKELLITLPRVITGASLTYTVQLHSPENLFVIVDLTSL